MNEKINLFAQFATIAAVIFAGVTIIQTQGSIESTNTLIKNTNATLTSLNALIETNTKQLAILEESLKTQKDQPILDAYSSLGEIKLKFQCGVLLDAPFLSLKPLIMDEKNTQTIVPIELHLLFNIYGKSSTSENYTLIESDVKPLVEAYQHNLQQKDSNVLLLMSPFFEKAEKEEYDRLRIETFYTYLPYAPNTRIPLSEIVIELEPKLLTEFKNDSGNWIIDVPDLSLCAFLNN